MLLAVANHRGSPGTTTTALLAARLAADARGVPTTLVEADSDGGILRHALQGLDTQIGFTSWAAQVITDPTVTMFEHSQPIDVSTNARVLLAPPTGGELVASLETVRSTLLKNASHPKRMVVVDCGRLGSAAIDLFVKADVRWVLTQPEYPDLLSLRMLLDRMPSAAASIQVLTRGDTPYDPTDLTEVGLHGATALPENPKVAKSLFGQETLSAKKFRRSPLVKTVNRLVPHIDLTEDADEDDADSDQVTLTLGG